MVFLLTKALPLAGVMKSPVPEQEVDGRVEAFVEGPRTPKSALCLLYYGSCGSGALPMGLGDARIIIEGNWYYKFFRLFIST